jgi:hypothetical protein
LQISEQTVPNIQQETPKPNDSVSQNSTPKPPNNPPNSPSAIIEKLRSSKPRTSQSKENVLKTPDAERRFDFN